MSARVAVTSALDSDSVSGGGGVRRSSLKYALGVDGVGDSTHLEQLDTHTELAQQHSLRATNSNNSSGANGGAGAARGRDVDTSVLSHQDSERKTPLGDPPRLRSRRSRLQVATPEDVEMASPRVRSEATSVTPSTTVSLSLDLRSMTMRRASQPSRRSLEDLEDSNRVRRRRSTHLSGADPSLATTVYSPRTSVMQSPTRRADAGRYRCSLL